MSTSEIHRAQISILRTLRHSPAVRYTDMMRPTGLESDVFKFHLRKLINQHFVQKLESGTYELTAKGKEFANNISDVRRAPQKQPKLSVAVIVSKGIGSYKRYLFQQRLRSPFYGFWSCVSGPMQWGESIEETARRELKKQTGLSAEFAIKSFYRKTDVDNETDALLEDKLFAVVEANHIVGELSQGWPHGHNQWMTITEFQQQEKFFQSTCDFIAMIDDGMNYKTQKAIYDKREY